MSSETQSHVFLAIESAIRGGSICLLDGPTVLGSRYGRGDISRAEDLLENIAELCESCGIGKSQINSIAVSRGPGSYTGIRIGLATAMGLARALDRKCLGVELLRSMANLSESDGRVIAAVPFGRHDTAWQEFVRSGKEITAADEAIVDTIDRFKAFLSNRNGTQIVVHHDLWTDVEEAAPHASAIENPAHVISIAAQAGLGSPDLTPIYLRNPGATGQF